MSMGFKTVSRLALLLVALCLPVNASAATPVPIVSATGSNYSGSTTSSLTTAAFNSTGSNFVVVGVRYNQDSGETISSVTDTAGNTYQLASGAVDTFAGARMELWYAMNATSHASNVVTVNMGAAVDYWTVNVAAYSGMATASAFDAVATGQEGSGGNDVTTGTFTTAQADELIVGVSAITVSGTWSVGTGLTTIRVQDGLSVVALADAIVSSIQTGVTATMTNTSTTSKHLVVATFKAAAAASGWRNMTLLGVGN
jgi:hypothetical protein